jgi:sporulation protein YlmC with PRC-barrel domain
MTYSNPYQTRGVAFMLLAPNRTRMTDILAENLSGKTIMGTDGTELGDLYNITMDLKTGSLTELLVTPREEVTPEQAPFEFGADGRFHVPVERVQAVKDHVVVRTA